MYLVINKWVIAVKVSNFSGQYLRKHWTLDIGVLGYIGIVWPKEHSPEVWSVPPATPCIYAGPSSRAIWGVGLRPLACWDCGFEPRREHGCQSLMSVVCCQVEASATDWSLVRRSPTDCDASLCVMGKPHEWGGPGPLGGLLCQKKEISVLMQIGV